MAKTLLLTVGSSPVPIRVRSLTPVAWVNLKEDSSVADWPTTEFEITGPAVNDAPVRFPAGVGFIFDANAMGPGSSRYPPGTLLGYLTAVTGTTTFQQVEQP